MFTHIFCAAVLLQGIAGHRTQYLNSPGYQLGNNQKYYGSTDSAGNFIHSAGYKLGNNLQYNNYPDGGNQYVSSPGFKLGNNNKYVGHLDRAESIPDYELSVNPKLPKYVSHEAYYITSPGKRLSFEEHVAENLFSSDSKPIEHKKEQEYEDITADNKHDKASKHRKDVFNESYHVNSPELQLDFEDHLGESFVSQYYKEHKNKHSTGSSGGAGGSTGSKPGINPKHLEYKSNVASPGQLSYEDYVGDYYLSPDFKLGNNQKYLSTSGGPGRYIPSPAYKLEQPNL